MISLTSDFSKNIKTLILTLIYVENHLCKKNLSWNKENLPNQSLQDYGGSFFSRVGP